MTLARRLAAFAVAASVGRGIAAQVPTMADDPYGIAVPSLVHLVSTTDPLLEGGTAFLRARDPWLLYELGRELVLRKYSKSEGAYGRSGARTVPMYVGPQGPDAPARFARDHAASCATCHSIPYREPGGGQTIASTGSLGRNSPHFYGAGLVEMIGETIHARLLAQYDRNHNGVFDLDEVGAARAWIRPTATSPAIDFGSLAIGSDGRPQLNPLFRIWYLDADRHVIAGATSAHDRRVKAFDFVADVFGWGRGYQELPDGSRIAQGAEAATLRGIFAVAADVHMGLQSFDPTQIGPTATGVGGYADVSLSGERQVDFGEAADRGLRRTLTGLSLDDPDGDGVVTELTAGDLDAAEFYMLHAPQPAAIDNATTQAGRRVFDRVGCAMCHVPDWQIDHDRRLFRVDTTGRGDAQHREITGRLVTANRASPSEDRPFLVRGIYSDFKHWDIGEAFYEQRFDGTIQREHRTAPLWGIADTSPYGTSGQYQTLEEAIRAHGGAAASSAAAFSSASAADRARLLEFLRCQVLFATDRIPMDIDGDGRIAAAFSIDGIDVGYERLDPRFLFTTKPAFRILYRPPPTEGRRLPLLLLVDSDTAFRRNAPYRRDSDGDGVPDVSDPTPTRKGIQR